MISLKSKYVHSNIYIKLHKQYIIKNTKYERLSHKYLELVLGKNKITGSHKISRTIDCTSRKIDDMTVILTYYKKIINIKEVTSYVKLDKYNVYILLRRKFYNSILNKI